MVDGGWVDAKLMVETIHKIAPTINFVKDLKLGCQIQSPKSQLFITELKLEEDC